MFNKILIANRGEIACRIARTAGSMGVETVAVYSDADRNALHVRSCDEAVYIGGSQPGESYLSGEKIIRAALDTGAEAIHPGFGFLSENADFAEKCAHSGLVFIGPPPAAIRSMGSKSTARKIMHAAGVPVLPGYDGESQNDTELLKQARNTGFPLLVKAVMGGGGKGLRRVEHEAEFNSALASVKRESLGAFGDDRVLLERYLPVARHIEVQIFADTQGEVVHLFERDCSLQRRHQKVIEEAPAPGIDEQLCLQMRQSAILCARATDYVGAGTVEFLLAPDDRYYFLEMNTRLQVEHPVTEMISGQDLVAWQLIVAAGEPMPADQASLTQRGHAIEARIYAENPQSNFLPSTGKLELLRTPVCTEHVRIDTGVEQGDEISAYYDPMIAKLICRGENRGQALKQLRSALSTYFIIGPKTNISFLSSLCAHPDVSDTAVTTNFIDTHLAELTEPDISRNDHAAICAALIITQKQLETTVARQEQTADPWSPWADSANWRVTGPEPRVVKLHKDDEQFELHISKNNESWSIDGLSKPYTANRLQYARGHISLHIDGTAFDVYSVHSSSKVSLLLANTSYTFKLHNPQLDSAGAELSCDIILAPMPGKITGCHVAPDQLVKKGDVLMVLEAMKMEHSIQAPRDGTISRVCHLLNDQVEESEVLLEFENESPA